MGEIQGGDGPWETVASEKQIEGFGEGWVLDVPGGGCYGGHALRGALGVVPKQGILEH